MQALQKKRDEFRKQIRKNQLDKFRQQKRKALFRNQINFELFKKVDHIFGNLEELLVQSTFKAGRQYSMTMTSASFNNEPSTIKHIVNCFEELKSLAPYEYEQIFTKYMLEGKSAERLKRILTDLITNEIQCDEDEIGNHTKQKYNPIIRARAILQILKFLDTLSFIVLGYDSNIFLIIGGLWNVVTDQLLFDEMQKFGFLKYTLSILGKILQDSKNQSIFSHITQKGLGRQIVTIIGRVKKYNVPIQIHENILILINNYLSCQIPSQSDNNHKIGEISITTSAVNQKETMMAYCVVFLAKHELSLYPIVLPAISKIIEIYQFLTASLKDQFVFQICELVLHEDRKIQVEALNLLNDFTYHSQDCLDNLLKKGYILDVLHKRLYIERTKNDQNVNSCVEKIAFIICNCLLTQKHELKKIVLGHYLWEDVYMSLQPSNRLFPLIITMTYFFHTNGHKKFDKYLVPYLQALRNFDWKECKYSNEIRRSIENTYHNAYQHWQDHEYKLFLRILWDQGFFELVEDYCEPDVVNEIKGSME